MFGVMASKLEVGVCVGVMARKNEVAVCWCDDEQVRGCCVLA